MSKLPELPSRFEASPTILEAYPVIKDLERRADKLDKLLYARILGYLTLEGPGDQSAATVAQEVRSCKSIDDTLDNILTLNIAALDLYDRLDLWFEPVHDRPNTYYVKYANSLCGDRTWKTEITFETPDQAQVPVPNPQYLALHAACARVAHLSGAGEYIEKILRDLEDSKILSEDGGSSAALEYALMPWVNAEFKGAGEA